MSLHPPPGRRPCRKGDQIGRLARYITHCLLAANGEPRSTGELMRWCYPRLKRGEFRSWHLTAVKRVAREICVAVGTGSRRNILWVLKDTAATF